MEYVPTHFKIGILVPIPKGTKDKTNQDRYRGLTLLSTIGKIYENCINTRFVTWTKDNRIINDVQGAGIEHCSSLSTAWVVK